MKGGKVFSISFYVQGRKKRREKKRKRGDNSSPTIFSTRLTGEGRGKKGKIVVLR